MDINTPDVLAEVQARLLPIAGGIPGTHAALVLQGCGHGQGGSLVALECGDSRLEFTVEETGHFQRFVPRDVGLLTLAAGTNTLQVRPVRKAQAAVMDLRRVMLERMD
jgi:hypothetical protein